MICRNGLSWCVSCVTDTIFATQFRTSSMLYLMSRQRGDKNSAKSLVVPHGKEINKPLSHCLLNMTYITIRLTSILIMHNVLRWALRQSCCLFYCLINFCLGRHELNIIKIFIGRINPPQLIIVCSGNKNYIKTINTPLCN